MTTKNDGGPAFARSAFHHEDAPWQADHSCQTGMSLRDWFAGQALAGMEEPNRYIGVEETKRSLAKHARNAYEIADAMLAARGSRP